MNPYLGFISNVAMSVSAIIQHLQTHLNETDITICQGASDELISKLEQIYNIRLPDDIKQFYQFTNGFMSEEDIFNIVPIEEMIDSRIIYGKSKLYIAEYMVYCDTWELEINPGNHNEYTIFNTDHKSQKIVLTNSFAEFLQRFLIGGVFEQGGLYHWNDEVRRHTQRTVHH